MAAVAKKTVPEPASVEELLTGYQLQIEVDVRRLKEGLAAEHQKMAVRVGQLTDNLDAFETRVATLEKTFCDVEYRFAQTMKEANEILRTSVKFSQEATKKVDVLDRLSKEQGTSERRNFGDMHRSIGELRDEMRVLKEQQNDLRGAFDEATA
jgi:hypothetical protein